MNYGDKLKQSKEKVYNFAIATKILDLMDKLRMDATNSSERRWVWELLQNAKDVGFDDKSVSIEINFDKVNSFLEFKHNGKPFTVDNITFLIEQVSTKERKVNEGEKPKTTGKFGTGFLTTHLLSEKVNLNGVVKEPDLPFRKFDIVLDRSGREIQEITDSVNLSISILENLDSYPAFNDFNPSSFNTSFKYNLDEKGIKVAEIGLTDLQIALPFTLAFLPKIKSVLVSSDNTLYELENIEKLSDEISLIKIIKTNGNFQQTIEIVTLEDSNVSIAIEIEKKNGKTYLKEFDKLMPRLFCDFPLIGTEDFHFPVIVNSSLFNPNEPRNGIYLTDKTEQKILDNKELMKKALTLYFSLLDFASENDWQNMFHLAKIWQPSEKNWISKTWYETELLKPARTRLLSTKMVDTKDKNRTSFDLQDGGFIDFPYHPKKEIRERIWELCNVGNYFVLPVKEQIHDWYSIIWDKKYTLTLETIIEWVSTKKNLLELSNFLSKTEGESLEWLNCFYALISEDDKYTQLIAQSKYAVIPNQNGVFCLFKDLSIDKDIETELKNVLNILGIDIRSKLLDMNVRTYNPVTESHIWFFPTATTQENIIDTINKIIKEGKNEKIAAACTHLISCFSEDKNFPEKRQKIYEFAKSLWKWSIPEKVNLIKWSSDIWSEVDKWTIKTITQKVSNEKNIDKFSILLNSNSSNTTIEWIDNFVTFLCENDFDSHLNLKTSPILPNQNGHFIVKDDLFLDNGEIDEGLKDISANLGYDFREKLLDKDIYLVLPTNRVITQEQVAEEIAKLIRPLFAEFPRSQETKQIFKALYLWFSKNKAISENIFEELYKNKHKLYDDDEIAENMQKVEMLDEILSEQGMTLEDLLKLASKGKLKGLLNEKEDKPKITLSAQDALISLGITTVEELEKALKDRAVYENFSHISSASLEMLQYVLSLIEQAKINVKKHLGQLSEYNTSNWHELAVTVIGGVTKNGKPLNIVVRPSNGGQVIFYYSSEKDTLEQANAELWIDDNIKEPQHLTLGRILKRNRIDRVSV